MPIKPGTTIVQPGGHGCVASQTVGKEKKPASVKLVGARPANLRKFSTNAVVSTTFTSCGWPRCRPLFVINVAETDMFLPIIRSIATFPWIEYGYSKSLATFKVN